MFTNVGAGNTYRQLRTHTCAIHTVRLPRAALDDSRKIKIDTNVASNSPYEHFRRNLLALSPQPLALSSRVCGHFPHNACGTSVARYTAHEHSPICCRSTFRQRVHHLRES